MEEQGIALVDNLPFERETRSLIVPPTEMYPRCRFVSLSPLEWRVFEILWENKHKEITTTQIYDPIWRRTPTQPLERIVSTYILELRRKLKGTGWCIVTRKSGRNPALYRLEPRETSP